MFYYIRGRLVRLSLNYAVVDTNGVGYKLWITANTQSKISSMYDKEVLLYTHFVVRDDAQELYGFYTEEEQRCFEKLLGVSGVGPKAALAVLTLCTPEKLSFYVSSGDANAISKANGVGLKTAQKIIIELKGKLKLDYDGQDGVSSPTALSDAVNTLTTLGYTKAEATAALRGIDPSLPLEEMLTLAFKKLNKF